MVAEYEGIERGSDISIIRTDMPVKNCTGVGKSGWKAAPRDALYTLLKPDLSARKESAEMSMEFAE